MTRNLIFASVALLAACSTTEERLPDLPAPDAVDLQRFMGDWYVLGFIPLPPERDAYNGIETYELATDGSIHTTYRFRKGGFDQPLKTYRPTAFVVPNSGNAQWKMQFIWPLKADYRIAWLADDYSATIIGRDARDYVWIMARSPQLPNDELTTLEKYVEGMGYDMRKYKRHPQQWPEFEARPPKP